MNDRTRLTYSIAALVGGFAVAAMGAVALMYVAVHKSAWARVEQNLANRMSVARLVGDPGGSAESPRSGNAPSQSSVTVSSLAQAWGGFAETGRVFAGRRQGDSLIIYGSREPGRTIAWSHPAAEAFRRAISGEQGRLTAVDFHGRQSFMGYAPLHAEGPLQASTWAIVAITEVAEVDALVERAAWSAAMLSLLVVLIVAGILAKLSRPLVLQLEETDARAQVVLDTAVEAIITIDDAGIVLEFNKAAEQMLGFSAREALGQNVSRFVPEPHRSKHDAYIESYVASGEAKVIGIGREVQAQRKDGSVFPVELAVSEVLWEHGRLFTGVMRDITSRKAARDDLERARDELAEANRRLVHDTEKLVRTEKLSSIGLLASGVAHEINNPLSGVMACIKSLKSKAVPVEREDEYFSTAQDALERIETIVRGLLDFSRQGPAKLEALSVGRLVDDSLRLAAPAIRKKSIDLVNDVGPEDGSVVGDRSQLMQVIMNIVLNAVHAVEAQGRIAVSMGREAERTAILIEDDGRGMSPKTLSRVCEPFYTTKAEGEGTGLGLAVSLGIVQAHGGELDIRSAVGVGTTVTIWLPSAGVDDASNIAG